MLKVVLGRVIIGAVAFSGVAAHAGFYVGGAALTSIKGLQASHTPSGGTETKSAALDSYGVGPEAAFGYELDPSYTSGFPIKIQAAYLYSYGLGAKDAVAAVTEVKDSDGKITTPGVTAADAVPAVNKQLGTIRAIASFPLSEDWSLFLGAGAGGLFQKATTAGADDKLVSTWGAIITGGVSYQVDQDLYAIFTANYFQPFTGEINGGTANVHKDRPTSVPYFTLGVQYNLNI